MNLNLFIAKKIKGTGIASVSNGIACASVAVSIIVMLTAIAVSGGFKKEIGEKAVGFTGEIVLTAPGLDYMNDSHEVGADLSYSSDILALEPVISMNPVAYRPGMLKTDQEVHGAVFKGVDSVYSLDFYKDFITRGRLPYFGGKRMSDEILISQRLADMMGYGVGDAVTAYFVGERVRVRRFEVAGLYDIELEGVDEKLVLADVRQIRRLNGWDEDGASCIEIFLGGDGSQASAERRMETAVQIGNIIMDKMNLAADDPVVPERVEDIYPNLFDWLALLDLNVAMVLGLMIAVAGFNMISGLLIILFEKISMIGLLKALGMRTRDICKVFLARGGAIVLKGMLIGNAIGIPLLMAQKYLKLISLSPENYFVDSVPVSLTFSSVIVLNVAAFVLMMLVMTIPSVFISRVSPERTIKVS